MTPALIGITSGLLIIILINFLKRLNKSKIYALALSGLGFLYVGFTWTDTGAVILTSLQAIIFLIIAYYGLSKNLHILAVGFFLHGLWDLLYSFWQDGSLIPPNYDMFCMLLNYTVGVYLTLKVIMQKSDIGITT